LVERQRYRKLCAIQDDGSGALELVSKNKAFCAYCTIHAVGSQPVAPCAGTVILRCFKLVRPVQIRATDFLLRSVCTILCQAGQQLNQQFLRDQRLDPDRVLHASD
jgi:hypothetical protein